MERFLIQSVFLTLGITRVTFVILCDHIMTPMRRRVPDLMSDPNFMALTVVAPGFGISVCRGFQNLKLSCGPFLRSV